MFSFIRVTVVKVSLHSNRNMSLNQVKKLTGPLISEIPKVAYKAVSSSNCFTGLLGGTYKTGGTTTVTVQVSHQHQK